MPTYEAPLRDMRYLLDEVFAAEAPATLPGLGDFGPDLVGAILEEAGRFCATVLQPLNRSGDEEGCRLENGVVRTPAGFREAYAQFREAGWTALSADTEHGGQGAPAVVTALFQEMMCAANLSFAITPGLSHGAAVALARFGSSELKARYLPRLVDGTMTGTMCLTEPQCGTDLGLVRTRAEPLGDGRYALTGSKIFISAGDHDLTDGIVHLVLARLPDAPKGIAGISLFLVPTRLPGEDWRTGEANRVVTTGLERKMGIHASPTCALAFEGAVGWLVGEPHRGMRAMFAMMNAARLAVGAQGLGLAEVAYQNAVVYARERLQGRALAGPAAPDRPADPILVHPDVRRMLLTARALTEGSRALLVWTAGALDVARRHPDAARRQEADDFVQLMTPVVKAFVTDVGFEVTNLGVQVLGGHGYIRDNGLEQFVRDARIAQIYEGTNGVQALDLVGRKMATAHGRALRRFFHPVAAHIERSLGDPALADLAGPLAKAFGRLQQATATVARRGLGRPEAAAAAASDLLRLLGLVALGHLWLRMAETSRPRLGDDPGGFHAAKLATAAVYMERVLPESGTLLARIMAGDRSLAAFPDDAF